MDLPAPSACLSRKCLASGGNVLAPLSQRRNRDGESGDAIEQILAELPLLYRTLQVLVGRRHHPDVDGNGGGSAHPLDFPLLQDAQQPGERPPFMSEQLAFDERLGNGGAIDGLERPLPTRAVEVNGPGHQLLAGAALAANEDRDVPLCGLLHQRVHLPHFGAGADHAGK